MSSYLRQGLKPVRIPRSRWLGLLMYPVITSSTTNGRCSEPWAGKTGVHLKKVNITTDQDGKKIPRDWKDTWKFAAGVHFRPVDNWLLQVGFSYDTSPVDSDDRTPDMPMDRQIRYATGVQYKWSDRLSVGGEFVYADYGKAKIDNDLLKGDYKRNDIFFFAMNANWKF